MNEGGDCRTALATPGLLKIQQQKMKNTSCNIKVNMQWIA